MWFRNGNEMKSFKVIIIGLIFLFAPIPNASGQSLETHFKKAQSLYKAKKYDQAISHFEKVVEILKENKRLPLAQKAQINLAKIYLIQGESAVALRELEVAKKLYSKPDQKTKIDLYSRMATAHSNLKQYANAILILEELLGSGISLTPDQKANFQANLADAYRRSELHSKAIPIYQQALKFYDRHKIARMQVLICNAMGLSYNKRGDFSNAVKSLEKSLKLASKIKNPQFTAEANSNLGIVYWDKGEYPKALTYIAAAKQIEQKHNFRRNLGVDYNNEGLVYKSVGNYNKGLSSISKAILIAQEVENIRDEAIAWSNHALIKRIQGKHHEAFEGYQRALDLYEQDKFQEGIAGCYMGLGKLYEIRDLNYQLAYENYQKAFMIYQNLGTLGYQAEALNQIGRVLKKGINRQRTTRDLIFEDESPTFIEMPPKQAISESIAAYEKALKLGRITMRKEVVWSALQGLGYALKEQGEIEKSFKRYQMECQEIYKNEIMKNAMRVANLNFEDPAKAKLADQMNSVLGKQKKIDQLRAKHQSSLPENKRRKNVEQRKISKHRQGELKNIEAESKKLESTFEELLAKWRKLYPNDADLFDSATEIDFDVIKICLPRMKLLSSTCHLARICKLSA